MIVEEEKNSFSWGGGGSALTRLRTTGLKAIVTAYLQDVLSFSSDATLLYMVSAEVELCKANFGKVKFVIEGERQKQFLCVMETI